MLHNFSLDMLVIARQARGLSQTELALASSISQSKLSKIEKGLSPPTEDLINKFANVLNFRPDFFMKRSTILPQPVSFHRKRAKLSISEWSKIFARSELYRFALEDMLASVELVPNKQIPPIIDPDEYDSRIEDIAMIIRKHWMVPPGPISDLARLIEDSGIVIIPFDFGNELIDGFSQHAVSNLPPIIFLNSRFKAKDRIRFTLAHELGHIVMHRTPNVQQEIQANLFASSLLMPSQDILPYLYSMSLEKIMKLKLHWKTSMQSIIRKARDLGKISERGYKYYCIQMSSRGWRSNEPMEITEQIEIPTTFKQLIKSHLNDLSYTWEELSKMFGLTTSDAADMFSYESIKPKLKLVFQNNISSISSK